MKDRRVFEIEKVQPPERAGFPSAHLPARCALPGLLLYLTRDKVPEMFPEEFFKLLEVAVVTKNCGIPLAVLVPIRKELLQGVPLLTKGFPLRFWFQRRSRLRTVAVHVQWRNPSVLVCVI